MVVEITYDESCNDWIAYEFQGVIESKGKIEGAEIGTISLKDGKPTIVIGNHEIKGELVQLKTPLCIIKKKEDSNKMQDSTDPSVEYSIVGLVNKKYLFKGRPVTVVNK